MPLFALALFAGAIAVLHYTLRQYHLSQILHSLREVPLSRIVIAFFCTVASYCLLTGYDALALRYVGRRFPLPRIAFVSFISYAFANNTGSWSLIASSGVRYRLYGGWGLSVVEVSKVIAFGTLTFLLGFAALAGLLFSLVSVPLPGGVTAHFLPIRLLGGLFLLAAGSYLLVGVSHKQPIALRAWQVDIPAPSLMAGQFAVAIIDLLVTATALYVLLPVPNDLSFWPFVTIFLAALLIGLLSNVPGGLGVFESAMLLFLSPHMSAASAAGALLLFRAVYYLVPLGGAVAILGGYELLQHRQRLGSLTSGVGRLISLGIPHILALAVFASGALLLFSGATPALRSRLLGLALFVPLPLLELSHFLGSVSGMGLLLLAAGLRRRLDAAFYLTALLLGAGGIFSLLKGLDYEAAGWLFFLLLVLLACRKEFYRKTPFLAEALSPGWIAAVAIVVASSIWLGFFANKHVEYTQDLWWQFALHGDAPRFLRATVGVLVLALLFAWARLVQPLRALPPLPGDAQLAAAAAIAREFPATYAHLALLGDKHLLFNEAGNAYLMYGVQGGSWVALGDPVGQEEEARELVWDFCALCDRYGGQPVFYEVNADNLPWYLDLGLTPIKIGEDGRVMLEDFSLEGAGRKGLRYLHNRMSRQGCSFRLIPAAEVEAHLPLLRDISEAWLNEKQVREKGFSLGFFKPEYLRRFPIATVIREGRVIAFANLLPGGKRQELSVDLMRYLPGIPSGVMEYLFVEIMLWGKAEGYQWFNLGMAPLAGFEGRALGSGWNRIGAFIYRHGEHFYNFQGLRSYKEKFSPVWRPRYLVSRGGLRLPRVLMDTAALISGGVKGLFLK